MRKKIISIVCLLSILTVLPSCHKENEVADLIVYGSIYTSNTLNRHTEAFAVKNGKYIAVGKKEDVDKYLGKKTRVIETPFAMSGGVESHGHFLLFNAFKEGLFLNPIKNDGSLKTKEDIIAEVVEYKRTYPNLDRIFGYGWSQLMGYLDLSADDIDKEPELKDISVYLAETSLHGGWCNSKCLQEAGITKDTVPSNIGSFILDEDGNPNGLLMDEACTYVRNKVFGELTDIEGYKRAIKNTNKQLHSMGYVMHYDMWTNYDGTDFLYKALKQYSDSGEASCLYAGAYCFESFELNNDNIKSEIKKVKNLRNVYEGQYFKPSYIKLFKDGVIEAMTGYVSRPYYNDEQYGHGNNYWNLEFMKNIVVEANKNDLLVHVHSYGDLATKDCVDSFIYANENVGYHRNSLGHVALVDEEDYKRIADNQIGCALASNWSLPEFPDTIENTKAMIGEDEYINLYQDKKFIDNGVKAAISTDYPCGTQSGNSVFDYIGILLTGLDYANDMTGLISKRSEHISLEQAIDMATYNGAWMANLEMERGSIEVGKYADFMLTDKNPFNVDIKEIHSIKINKLFFEGQEISD